MIQKDWQSTSSVLKKISPKIKEKIEYKLLKLFIQKKEKKDQLYSKRFIISKCIIIVFMENILMKATLKSAANVVNVGLYLQEMIHKSNLLIKGIILIHFK